MKKILLCNLIIVLAFLLYSCKDANETSGGETDTTTTGSTGSTNTGSSTTENTIQEEKTTTSGATDLNNETARLTSEGIRIQFPEGATQVTVPGMIEGIESRIVYVFEASEGQVLNATVAANEREANIRINQIIAPSGSADGPFGATAEYKLTETGDWKLIVGESLMEGESWKGNYNLTIEIK